ncbi:MAG: hypothetical protein K8W52_39885 [Deltaproteobacteria bacterium]|nr:hypothetical protein [Deltaproteobacteria bacterium]
MAMAGPRSAGPIPIAPHVARVLKLCEAIRTTATSAAMRADATPGVPRLLLGLLTAVEDELRTRLPDDIIALAACAIPAVACASGLDLEGAIDLDALARERGDFPDDLIVIGRVDADPFAVRDDGAHGGAAFDVCIPREPAGARTIVWLDGRADQRVAIDDLVHDTIAARYRDADAWPAIIAAVPTITLDRDRLPALVGALPPVAALPPRRVFHPSFGEGTVVAVLDGGKLEIAFDFAGRKVLLARFVRDA